MTLALLLTAVTGAWAQGPWTSGDCTVTLSNGTLTVSGKGAMADYIQSDNRPWDGNKGDITSVVVESGVTSVGKNTFESFSNLTSVTLPEDFTAIGPYAFSYCTSLQSITIPSTVTSIGEGAFESCESMTSVTLPEGLTAIGAGTFSSCSSLTSITIPSTVTSIGTFAFKSCSSLTSITIPSMVTSIGDYAFMSSSAISDVNLYANPDNLTWGNTKMNFKQNKATKCHVLAEHLSAYQNNFSSVNVTFVGDLKPLPTPIDVTPVTGKTNEWTFTMPAYDVEIAPIYAPTAVFATDGNLVLTPTAIEGIYAESTDAIVKAGTVAKIGETEKVQGIVMYAVTSTNQATAPALTAFSADVPTAKDITVGSEVLVWYYIKGADTPEGEEATAENTFNDSEICATPLTVTVLSNKFDIQFKAANDNTIEAGKATVTVGGTAATVTEGKLEGVKMGSEVKVKAKDGYKFRKAEAKEAQKPLN